MTAKIPRRAALSALSALLALAASANAAPPKDKDACFARAFALAERASKAKLPKEKAAEIEPLLAQLESECQSGTLDKAGETDGAIEKALGGGK